MLSGGGALYDDEERYMSKINQNSYYEPIQLCPNNSCFPLFLSNVIVCICGLQRAESWDSRSVAYLY